MTRSRLILSAAVSGLMCLGCVSEVYQLVTFIFG